VGTRDPFNAAWLPLVNPEPDNVTSVSGSPTFAAAGESVRSAGIAFNTETVAGAEAPPPGVGFVTTSDLYPAVANCAAFAETISCVAPAEVTDSATPASVTVEVGRKPDPVRVSVVAAEPTGIVAGATNATPGVGYWRLTFAVADLVGSAVLMADTCTAVVGTVPGAVYKPEELIVPAADVPPVVPFTSQVTRVSEVPVTLAVNCVACPTSTVKEVGETVTTMDPAGGACVPVDDEEDGLLEQAMRLSDNSDPRTA
jgi:hypothetical protein